MSTTKFILAAIIVAATLVCIRWLWSPGSNPRRNADQSEAVSTARVADRKEPTQVVEILGLGVTYDKYRQSKLLNALSEGSPWSPIRDLDPKNTPWARQNKLMRYGLRAGNAVESGAKGLPMYTGIPVFTALPPSYNKRYADVADNPFAGTDGSWENGVNFRLFLAAGQALTETPDRLLERAFDFFDQHPEVPFLVVSAFDGLADRDDHRPEGSKSLAQDGPGIFEWPDSAVLFVLARRERVDALRRFVFDDIDEDHHDGELLNRDGVARRLMVAYLDLKDHVPHPQHVFRRTPTVDEWLADTPHFAKREDIYPRSFSVLDTLHGTQHAPADFKPTPWWPVPWNKQQLAAFDALPSLGFVHRPVFVKTVDAEGKPLTRRADREAALAAGWKQALEALPADERKAAPARIAVATGGKVEQTIALQTVLNDRAAAGGPELDPTKPTVWIDTDARLGNTGAATLFLQMAIGTMASYRDGGASAAINLRDPSEASIVFVTPPSQAVRDRQGKHFDRAAGASFDPAVYQER